MGDYNGWTNRATWAMNLDLTNEYGQDRQLESYARYAAIGNEEYEAGFYDELAGYIEGYARDLKHHGLLPDFQGEDPDDINEVNWLEIAESYNICDYI
jgi:hypothetical protein